MNWDDKGFLLSKTKYSENSIIVEIYTKDHGKIPGIIFGGTSKKIKNYLQIGNKLHVNFNSKSDTKIGYFKIEIEEALVPFYFDDNQKLSCISSAVSLIKLLSPEYQKKAVLALIETQGYYFRDLIKIIREVIQERRKEKAAFPIFEKDNDKRQFMCDSLLAEFSNELEDNSIMFL